MEHQTLTPTQSEYKYKISTEDELTVNYGDKITFPHLSTLRMINDHWKDEQVNPERSPRQLKIIDTLLARLAFEIRMREQEA